MLVPVASISATLPGTNIINTAAAVYTTGASSVPLLVSSNSVTVTTIALRTPSTLELLQYGPGAPGAQLVSVGTTSYSNNGTPTGTFIALAPPVHITPGVGSAPIDLSAPVPLVPATQFNMGEPVFIRLTDLDQNLDPAVRETVLVTIQNPVTLDTEVLRLLESGPNTGVFAGYIQTGPTPAASGNGVLQVATGSRINASYTDSADAVDTPVAGALVDPYGLVFSSVSGLPVDGATVTMIDASTGLPATVYGEDGVSIFPSAVVSGATATDGSGRIYTFTPGGYRFPFIVAPGTYRLVVTPPTGYGAPSQVATNIIQTLPGGPFAIVIPGSRGEDFVVNPGPSIHIDIPVDPVNASLWLVKTAGKQTAAVGDFVPYRLTVENNSTGNILAVMVTDRLPIGFRYRKGSARLNSATTADPVVSSDGRSLTFSAGDLSAGTKADIVYVAEVGAGARPGIATNTAVASGTPGAISNTAQATVVVIEDLFRSTATIVGRVSVDGCGDKERREEGGLAGVRIYREDGTFVVTDQNGMYHFAAVQPGTHVVQVDLSTLPEKYEVMACEENTRFAGTPFSQFVDLQGGALWRADFHVGLKPKQVGEVGIEILTSPKRPAPGEPPLEEGKDLIQYTVPVHVGVVPARNLKLSIMLPEGGVYRPGTAAFAAGPRPECRPVSNPTGTFWKAFPIDEPQEIGSTVTFRFAEIPANWGGTLSFDTVVPVSGPEGAQFRTSAILTADSPEGKNNRTPAVSTELVRGTRDELRPAPDIVLHPEFESGSAELTRRDKEELDRVISRMKQKSVEHITVTGHTDARRISPRLQACYPDNYALSYERAATVGAYIADGLGLTSDQITYDGKGPDEPVASNSTEQGRARNRRVELRIRPPKIIVAVPALVSGPPSGMKAVATMGLRPGEEWPQEANAEATDRSAGNAMPDYNAAWLGSAVAGFSWLWPPENYHPSIPSTKAAFKHDPVHRLTLLQDGKPVDPIYFEGTLKRGDGGLAVSTWSGINIVEGDNRFEVVVRDEAGTVLHQMFRIVHYSGNPVAAVFVPERSRLLADGIAPGHRGAPAGQGRSSGARGDRR